MSTDEIRKVLKHKDNENIEQLVDNTIDMSKTTSQIVSEFIEKNNLKEKIYHFHYPYKEIMELLKRDNIKNEMLKYGKEEFFRFVI